MPLRRRGCYVKNFAKFRNVKIHTETGIKIDRIAQEFSGLFGKDPQ